MSTAVAEPTRMKEQTGFVRPLAHDVGWVPLSIVNVYLVGPRGAASGNWALVDAGLSLSAPAILRAVDDWVGQNSRPQAIILTHGHFDHVGSVKALAERWDVPVYAHPLEMPFITGRSAYPPPDPTVGGGLMAFSSPLYSRGPIDLGQRVRPLPNDGSVPGMPGWRWLPTPGHSPGHVSLFRDADRFLIVGDAFVTTKQESAYSALTGRPTLVHRPPAYFTVDWQRAKNSVRALARLNPEYAAAGHGFPMRGATMRAQLKQLAEHFDEIAVPPAGRYVEDPARADQSGVTHVPSSTQMAIGLKCVAAATFAGLAIGYLTAGRKRN